MSSPISQFVGQLRHLLLVLRRFKSADHSQPHRQIAAVQQASASSSTSNPFRGRNSATYRASIRRAALVDQIIAAGRHAVGHEMNSLFRHAPAVNVSAAVGETAITAAARQTDDFGFVPPAKLASRRRLRLPCGHAHDAPAARRSAARPIGRQEPPAACACESDRIVCAHTIRANRQAGRRSNRQRIGQVEQLWPGCGAARETVASRRPKLTSTPNSGSRMPASLARVRRRVMLAVHDVQHAQGA